MLRSFEAREFGLRHAEDWKKLAQENRYSVNRMAFDVNISPKRLNVFATRRFRRALKAKLIDWRRERALELLMAGHAPQSIAADLSMTPAHFSSDMRIFLGMSPTQYVKKRKGRILRHGA